VTGLAVSAHRGEEASAVLDVARTVALRHERLDREPHELLTRVAEEPLRAPVREDDRAVGVDHEDAVRRELEERMEARLRARALHLGSGAHREQAQRRERALRVRERSAVDGADGADGPPARGGAFRARAGSEQELEPSVDRRGGQR
jgi:hypothetical protein